MNIKNIAIAACAVLALSACATEQTSEKASNTLDANALQAIFKKGGGSCTWSSGAVKGEDYYYSTTSKSMGEADRIIGGDTVQGSWSLKGNQLCTNFGTELCSPLEEVGKMKYKAVYGGKVYDLSC